MTIAHEGLTRSIVNESPLNWHPVSTRPNARGERLSCRDVAHVRNGFPPQTNIVRVNGQRAAMLSVIKSGAASR